jgi:hypothetical protein
MRFIVPILLLLSSCLPVLAADRNEIKLDITTAKAVFDELERSENYMDELTPDQLTKLPVGQKRTISNVQYIVGITQVKFHPDYAEFTAFLRIKVPQNAGGVRDLFFGASGIKLSHSGGIIGDVKLGLLGDYPMNFGGDNITVILKGAFDKNNKMIGGGVPVTYASIDCSGFKMMSISADVIFSRDLLIPDSAGIAMPGQVKTAFATTATDWNDILIDVSMPSFRLKAVPDFIFKVNEAVFDLSDLRNDPQTVFPKKYADQYLLPGNNELWRGVYVKNLDVTLPKLFSISGDSTARVAVKGKNVLIDNMGFTGLVTAENLVTIDKGVAGLWPISINRFTLDMVANKLEGAGFGGNIKLPVDEKTLLKYDALISPGNEYMLTVSPVDTISFGLFRASNVELYPNSLIELKVKDHKFLPRAVLNGQMTINASLKKDAPETDSGLAKIPAISFRGLELQTVSPKIKIEYMGYDGEISFGSFPASINNIEIATSNDEVRLGFGINVQLMGESDGGFNADARLAVIGKLSQGKGLESWRYDRIKLDSIAVSLDKGGIAIDGHIYVFEDDKIYGKGFAGDISMTLKNLNIKVQSKAVFGRKSDYRYWYADAFADLGGMGIKVFPGFKINGFGGGAYQRMKLKGKVGPGVTGIGVTPTGYLYEPDETTNFGLKAMVGFASEDGKAVNGHLTLEMAFAKGGGLRYINLDGVAKFMKDLPTDQFAKLEKTMSKLTLNSTESKASFEADRKALSNDAAVTASANINFDFENSSLHGVFDVYISAGPLKGIGQNNLAGSMVMHYDPSDWYIHMGRPDSRIGLQFGLGPVSLKVGSYLMVGTQVPASPPPPKIVADMLGVKLEQLDYMRDLNALGDGKGFAFGSDMSFTTGDLTFLIFYAQFSAGMGFDMMLKNYGETQCKGMDGTIGINGWYANGQAYAYMQGDIGLTFKLFARRKKINILTVGAAVLLQAKLPNPAWFRGYVGGHYSVLGGLVKGSCNFKVTLGDECEPVNGSPLGGITVIAQLDPAENSDAVDVFGVPQAVFNMAVDKEMELEDDNGNMVKYRVKLDNFSLTYNGNILSGKLKWKDGKDGVALYSDEVLPSFATVKASVVVSFEELKMGTWRPVMFEGKKSTEVKEVTFKTGEAPESIPLSNIQYAYPLPGQQHVYPAEYNKGYIRLKRGQSYLFDKSNGWKQALRQVDAAGNAVNPSWNYNTADKQLNWSLPALSNAAKYTLNVVNLPPAATGGKQEVQENYTTDKGEDENVTEVKNNKSAGSLTNSESSEKIILTYNFATSSYNTFADKIKASTVLQVMREPIYLPDVHALQVVTKPTEVFDAQELLGADYSENVPLIRTTALLEEDTYFKEDIKPLVYNNYPYGGITTLTRATGQSLIPVWAIYPIDAYLLYPDNTRMPFRYHLPKQYKTDLINIQTQLAAKQIHTAIPPAYESVLYKLFPIIRQGTYKMQLFYVLPGGITGSNAIVEMYNPVL